ncbi:MAG: DEAD/DEAH box helicase, partial [Bacteroidota bacterium]
MNAFEALGLNEKLVQAVTDLGFETPTPIQEQAIPILLSGTMDFVGLAQTGTGKTAAFGLPLLHLIDISQRHPQALIVCPTRELCLQITNDLSVFTKHTKGLYTEAVYGGASITMQIRNLKRGVHIVVATPGRLIDLIERKAIDPQKVKYVVLDEADEMLSMGFYDDLEFIIQCLFHSHQTLLFSATMPQQISKIAKQHMRDPIEVSLTQEQRSPDTIDHRFVYCHHEHKGPVLCRLIDELHPKQAIVFCRSRDEVERVCRGLKQHFKDVDYLHAGLSQDVRTIITGKFRTGRIRFLVATDVAARGLDFSGISHVFIYHLADDPDIYVHRS